ncbi:MAG TPA: N,N-dimethylformamidase beta subunit family domain-containing protein, partial [Streptosporangiaceae bacterium]|nr:N,N-dimethylformamidase beta subunit family domain-containing protein [Streptosporangiaceae bacterium]
MNVRPPHSRRAFLGLVAAATSAVAAACSRITGPGGGQPAAAATPSPRRPVSENALAGDPHWNIRHIGARNAMLGYAGQASVLPGEPITLYVSTTARSFKVSAFRMGWYNGDRARRLWKSEPVKGHQQRAASMVAPTNTVEAAWGPSLTVPTDDWPAGSYLLRLDADTGAQRYVPVTVRSTSTAGKVVIKNGTATWQAYNTWGGYDLYKGPSGAYGDRSLAVSLDRPYDQSGAYYFLWHEQNLISLAEQLGVPLAYASSMDIAAEPN